jgi:hypothetical protein
LKRQAIEKISHCIERNNAPALRNRTQLRFLEVARKEIDGLGRHTQRSRTVALRRYGIEIHEPRSEES